MAILGNERVSQSGYCRGTGSVRLLVSSPDSPESEQARLRALRVVVYSRQRVYSLSTIAMDLGFQVQSPSRAAPRAGAWQSQREIAVNICRDFDELLSPLERGEVDYLYFDATISSREREEVVRWARIFDPAIKVYINDEPIGFNGASLPSA